MVSWILDAQKWLFFDDRPIPCIFQIDAQIFYFKFSHISIFIQIPNLGFVKSYNL